MPMFTARFERQVVARDVYEEEIEAASQEEADARAEELAREFDQSCPDGAHQEGGENCRSWSVDGVSPVAAAAAATETAATA